MQVIPQPRLNKTLLFVMFIDHLTCCRYNLYSARTVAVTAEGYIMIANWQVDVLSIDGGD